MKTDQRRDSYQAVFNTPGGKEVLKDLGKFCEFEHSSFNSDPLLMAYKEGQKQLYRRILKQLEAK